MRRQFDQPDAVRKLFNQLTGRFKDNVEPVTRRLDHVAAMGLERPAQQMVMPGRYFLHQVGVTIPKYCAVFKVCKQESENS
jgi:hypothetical protein